MSSSEPNLNYNPFSDLVEDPSADPVGIQPPKVTKKRQRGLSLRSQLLNKNLSKNISRTGAAPGSNNNTNSLSGSSFDQISEHTTSHGDSIELQQMEEPYSSHLGVFRYEPEMHMPHDDSELDSTFNDSDTTQDVFQRDATHKRSKRGLFAGAKKLHNKILGVSELQRSLNGRRIPLSLAQEFTEPFTLLKNKHNEKFLLDERTNKPYCNNVITSSRYNIYSFFPRQLYFQFSKIANCYFMIVAIMQMIPSWSTTGTYTTIIPLLIFMSISILREGYDDFKRHVLDKEENNKKVVVLRRLEGVYGADRFARSATSVSGLKMHADDLDSPLPGSSSSTSSENVDDSASDEDDDHAGSFMHSLLLRLAGIQEVVMDWKDVKVGDVVRLKLDDWTPADILLLSSSIEGGETYIETMALDGETNLKSKHPHLELHNSCYRASDLQNVRLTVISEDPNIDLYNFEGTLELHTESRDDASEMVTKKYALDSENVVYRGSILRNTELALGMVLFTGEETKIRMNAIKNPRTKAPKLQKSINLIVCFMVVVVCCLAAFSTMAQRIAYDDLRDKLWYLRRQDVGVAATLMGFIIMYNTLIPLSLYVTMEIIKLVQFMLLQWDIDMYHKPSNTPMEARTATILEELGQVSYIFSDKTGTLTNNEMIFRKFTVAGVSWLHDVDLLLDPETLLTTVTSSGLGETKYTGRPSLASLAQDSGANVRQSLQMSILSWKSDANPQRPQTIKSTRDLISYLQQHQNTLFAKRAKFFLLSLALCHSCLPKRVKKDRDTDAADDDEDDDDDDDDDEIDYQAASPDELAIVVAARDMGYVVFDRKKENLVIRTYPNGFELLPVEEIYEILDVIEFTSSRKRMSVVVKFPDGRVCVFCKGADNIILERLKNADLAQLKMKELATETSNRKNAELTLVLDKRSMDVTNIRQSVSSLTYGSSSKRMESIDNYLKETTNDTEIDEIAESSRRSFQMQQQKKYGISEPQGASGVQAVIPSDNLVINDEYVIEKTLHHIEEFSTEGLRTLMYSYKWLDRHSYDDWAAKYRAAKTSLTNRNQQIAAVGELIEKDFELLGATAIEDKLQDGVAEAIEKLRRAGIKLWMLTGDKRETAINIGYSCRLIKDYSTVVILSVEEGYDVLADKIRAADFEIGAGNVAHSVIVIDGATLSEIEGDVTLMTPFIDLGVKADSVICCRASPSQKANMVLSVRNLNKKKVTLLIGDGANDIAMIQSADIGIGITGKEGLQAARSSDYSIAQFRYLLKLLLVHGRYNYVRTSKFVMCTFYKELLFYLTQAIYQRQDAFTGSSLYESWSLSMFNTLFTSLPVLAIGMFEKDLRPSTLLAFPELYAKGRNYESFNVTIFVYWMVIATSQSLLVSFISVYTYGFSALEDNTTYALCVLSFTTLVVLINTKCEVLEMKNITKINFIGWGVSVGGWLLWCCILPALYSTKPNRIFYVKSGLFHHFGKDYTWWATLFILVVIGVMFDLFIQSIRRELLPTVTDDFEILERDLEFRKKCEIHSFQELKQSWTWPHESALLDLEVGTMTSNQKLFYQTKSFIKKGKTHQRKRANTLPSETELPPGSPSVVRKVSAKDSGYETEILPSGKVIRRKLNKSGDSSTLNKIGSKFKFKSHDTIDEDDEDIEEIIKERIRGLEEEERRHNNGV